MENEKNIHESVCQSSSIDKHIIKYKTRKDKIYANKNECTKAFVARNKYHCDICNRDYNYMTKYDHLKTQKHNLKKQIFNLQKL